jgi:spore maturation protein CgeB
VVGEANTWFDHHVTTSLRGIGHKVTVFHYGEGVGQYYPRSRRSDRTKKNRALLEQARKLKTTEGLDLIFCYVYDDFLLPETAAALGTLGAPMINYNVDMTNQWYRQIKTARYFTLMLAAQRAHMNDLARYGAPVYYFPMATRAPTFVVNHTVKVAAPVTFVGSPMSHRIAVFNALIDAGIPLAIYGKFWTEGILASPDRSLEKTLDDVVAYGFARLRAEGMGSLWRALASRLSGDEPSRKQKAIDPSLLKGFLPEAEVPIVFRDSKINIGFTRMIGDDPHRPGITQIKLRDFEVPASGGFYLVEHVPEYADFFVPGKEVETWRTVNELIDKIRYYLSHEGERAAIAAAGQRRACRDHLWMHRFSDLFAKLGLG